MLLCCPQALEDATGKTAGANKEAFRAAMVRRRLALPACLPAVLSDDDGRQAGWG